MEDTGAIEPPGELIDDRLVPFPPNTPMNGSYSSLSPLNISHSPDLFRHLGGASNAALWKFLPREPVLDQSSFDQLIVAWENSNDSQHFSILNTQGEALGAVAFYAISPEDRSIEIGWVVLGNALKRTSMATEAFYLMLRRAFDELGYQRVVWRSNSLNKASLSAAARLGFTFEGTFRKHCIVKGKRRDTSWFSIIDDEWPIVRKGFEVWLDETNFDEQGQQKCGLKMCRETGN